MLLNREAERARQLVANNKSALGQNDHGESIESHRRDEEEVNGDGWNGIGQMRDGIRK